MEDDRVGGLDDIERRARAAEHRLCFVFARHFGWQPDDVLGLAWDTVDAFQDEFDDERDEQLAQQPDDMTQFQPTPEHPDASYWERQRVIAAIRARIAEGN